MQWVRGTSAASIIVAGQKNNGNDIGVQKNIMNRHQQPSPNRLYATSSTPSIFGVSDNSSSNNMFCISSGLDRGGSALSALPGSVFESITGKKPNEYISQWQGSSGLHNSIITASVKSSVSKFEQPSINFKGKPCWWNKKKTTKQKKLPRTNSRLFEKDFRDRYGYVKV